MTLDEGPVAILGSDGYSGWALTGHLLDLGYDVVGVDDFTRREKAAPSVTSIAEPDVRARAANEQFEGDYSFSELDIADYDKLEAWLDREQPAGIVNLAQIPAAPYSMVSVEHAWETQQNNIEGALNLIWELRELGMRDTPIVQLATMGPDAPGRYPYRAINQFDDAYRVQELAEMVADHTGAEIAHIENPREFETVTEDFTVDTETARNVIGFDAERTVEEAVQEMLPH